jgi:hypothetical protein
MVSRTARRVYFVCAFSLIYLFVIIVAVAFFVVRFHFASALLPAIGWLIEILVWPGVVGIALLWVAMWYFWFSFDSSGWVKKAMWFFLLYFLAPYAQPFYYFFVYRRSSLVKSSSEELHPHVQSKLLARD